MSEVSIPGWAVPVFAQRATAAVARDGRLPLVVQYVLLFVNGDGQQRCVPFRPKNRATWDMAAQAAIDDGAKSPEQVLAVIEDAAVGVAA